MLDLITAAIRLAASPVAFVGFIGLAVYAQRIWQAIKYGLLWALALQLFAVANGREDILDVDRLATTTLLRLAGALIVTAAIFYLARFLRRRA